jgi:sugar fermentation stimulation protein A
MAGVALLYVPREYVDSACIRLLRIGLAQPFETIRSMFPRLIARAYQSIFGGPSQYLCPTPCLGCTLRADRRAYSRGDCLEMGITGKARERPGTSGLGGGKRQKQAATSIPEIPYILEGLYENTSILHSAVLHKRYKRFLGDATLDAGEPSTHAIQTVHVPNTGPMTGLLDNLPAEALLSKSSNAKRKYAHTLEWMRVDGTWIGVHSAKANAMVGQLLDAGVLDAYLPAFTMYNREVRLGGGGGKSPATRIDFELVHEETGARCLVEVKSVTMKDGDTAVFPDTKSERAQKHVRELIEWRQKHDMEVMMLYVVQRDDCKRFLPSKQHDPEYYDLVRAGVEEGGLRVLVVEVGLDEDAASKHRVVFKGVLPHNLH